MALRRTFRVTLALLPLFLTAACESQPGATSRTGMSSVATSSDVASSQPRTATYSCADGGMMTIENLGSSVRLLGPDGIVNEELPASPSNQRSRYGEARDAIVLDGNEALVMKGGQTPLNCTR